MAVIFGTAINHCLQAAGGLIKSFLFYESQREIAMLVVARSFRHDFVSR
jgi:hypothetical protein